MKKREEPTVYDSFERFKQLQETNRQNAYQNKVCRKLVNRLFPKGTEDRDYWSNKLEASSEPLAELQDVLYPFRLYTHRMQSWSVNDLLKAPDKIIKVPLWQEFATIVTDCLSSNKDLIPAMVFYNSSIEQDMVMHLADTVKPPNGYTRLVRTSSSGEGSVVIDTLDGFMIMLGAKNNEV
jgi:hypothetical protein